MNPAMPTRDEARRLRWMAGQVNFGLRRIHGNALLAEGPPKASDVRVVYLPPIVPAPTPDASIGYFGAVVHATGKAILFQSLRKVPMDAAVEAIVSAPHEAWQTQDIKPIQYGPSVLLQGEA